MAGRRNGRGYECVVVDLNTQRDFCDADGVFPVANLPDLIPALRHMVAWSKRNFVPVVSSVESHRPGDLSDSGYPICCVDGSAGQRKIEFTLFPAYAQVEADNTLSCPTDLFKWYQQVIFRKRRDDLLTNPKADQFLTALEADEFVLFGVGVERSVKALALGLLIREKQVAIVLDACGYWHKATAELAMRQVLAKGARCITIDELLRRRLSRRRRYPIWRRPRFAGEAEIRRDRNGQTPDPAKSNHLPNRLPNLHFRMGAGKPNPETSGNDLQA
jgi:nicotinamidase-related amidase